MHPLAPVPPGPRPLVVTADPDLLDDLLRLAAAVGVEPAVAPDAAGARSGWPTAPLVLVGADAAPGCARARLARRPRVVVVSTDLDDAGVWETAVSVGAEHVAFLPDGEAWVTERLADAVEGGGEEGALLAVVGGRGGAGASSLACALGVAAARAGRSALLVDADPLGGGLDLCFGGEQERGLRWPDLAGTRGRLPAGALARSLPSLQGLALLSCDRTGPAELPLEALSAVLAAARRGCEVVVVDLPRWPLETARAVLSGATAGLVVVPADVRGAAATSRVLEGVAGACPDLRAVVRGPAPSGLTGQDVAAALGVPLAGELRPEPDLDRALERGEAPGTRARGPLAVLAGRLVEDLVPCRRTRRGAA